ncbi:MAG: EAL domain-containing protein [Magnetococcales bacterium]|nr:EAL domain-containing protein [Magnetococcales bacterium]
MSNRLKKVQKTAGLLGEKTRACLDIAATLFVVLDCRGRIAFLNQRFCRLLGWQRKRLSGRDWFETVVPVDQRQAARHFFDQLNRDGSEEIVQHENTVMTRDGRECLIIWHTSLLKDEAGRCLGFLHAGEDVTEQRRSQRELLAHRESMLRAQSLARFANWEMDLQNGTMFWSDEMFRIFGLDRSAGQVVTTRHFLQAVHTGDRFRVLRALVRARHRCEPFSLNHRVVRPDGQERVVRQWGEVVCTEEGAKHLVGVVHDITEEWVAREQLRIATRTFEDAMTLMDNQWRVIEKILESTLEGVMVMNAEGEILSVNAAFTSMTGMESSEVIGCKAEALRISSDHVDAFRLGWRGMLQSGEWRGELWNRRRNGEIYPEQYAMTAVNNPSGELFRVVAIFHDLSEAKRTEEELRYRLNYDPLTGLPNRHLFRERLQHAIHQAHRSRGQVAVVMFDLDLFKNVNDSLGLASGDRLIQEVARRTRDSLREGDTACRLGGDEFAIILEGLQQTRDAMNVIQKLFQVIEEPFHLGDHDLYVTVSMGITIFPGDGNDVDTLIRNVDLATNRAKDAGRNNFQFYTEAMDQKAARRMRLEADLRKGLEREEFVLYYQPKVDVELDRITGMEALIRWRQADGTMVSPGEFIPVAEETGLIVPMGLWTIETACRQVKVWNDAGLGPFVMAVNLSVRQFRQKDLVEQVQQVLEKTGLEARYLNLEITESLMMEDLDRAMAILEQLTALGLTLSMDDFGTGYSSLSTLKRFPINALKIDQSFVRDLSIDSNDASIVAAIISMAHNLGLKVVAEGVETLEHLNYLRTQLCDEIQGYYYSRPQPAEKLEALLRDPRSLGEG